jgi:hypothetical protein
VDGEGAKSSSRHVKKNPKEEKLRKGAGGAWAKPPCFATDSQAEQSPEGGRTFLAPWATTVGDGRKRQEGNGGRQARTADCEGNPLKSEPWTWQRGEINPQGGWRRKPSRACETPRAEQSGLWEARECGLHLLTSRWGKEPQGRCRSTGQPVRPAGLDSRTLKERKAHERMHPSRK